MSFWGFGKQGKRRKEIHDIIESHYKILKKDCIFNDIDGMQETYNKVKKELYIKLDYDNLLWGTKTMVESMIIEQEKMLKENFKKYYRN